MSPLHPVLRLIFLTSILLCFGCERAGREFLRTHSPGGMYLASFVGRPERPGVILQEHRVRLTFWRGGEVLASDREIHFADWLDDAFEHESHEWVRENVLRVGAAGHEFDDLLTVRNDSSRRLLLLRIWAHDMFFIADLEPGVALHLPAGGIESRYIGIDGLSGNGQNIEPSGEIFHFIRVPTEFIITVGDSDASIGRRDRLQPNESIQSEAPSRELFLH